MQPPEGSKEEEIWEVVVFKVENRLFHSFRHIFVEASEVFEGMFLLPQGESGEGGSKENPIALHPCNANDFASLVKVLHPTRKHVTAGKFDLTEQEWLGALRLSTMWEMDGIRELCVDNLYKGPGAIARLDLLLVAREFRVESWFLEAVTAMLVGFNHTPTGTLISKLGLPTACKIIDMKQNTTLMSALAIHPDEKPLVAVPLGRLRCSVCYALLFTKRIKCANRDCRADIDAPANFHCTFIKPEAATVVRTTELALGVSFTPQAICCAYCEQQLCLRVTCSSCTNAPVEVEKVFVGYTGTMIRTQIEEAFGEELQDYDL